MHYAVVRRRAVTTVHDSAIWCKKERIQYNTMQYYTIQSNVMQYHAMKSNKIQNYVIAYNSMK